MGQRDLRREGFAVISRLFDSLSNHGYENVVYRGQGDKSWDIIPSNFRAKNRGISNSEELRRWRRIAERFVQPRPQSDVEWLVLAQHYGIPTSLLDWTLSPIIALFFAAEAVSHRNGMVFMVNKRAFKEWDYLVSIDTFAEERRLPGIFLQRQ